MHWFPMFKRACAVLLAFIIALPLTVSANPEEIDMKTGVVKTDNLRLRAEASLSAKILAKANTNDVIIVMGASVKNKDGEWFNVTYDGQTGYMSAQYIEISKEDEDSSVAGKITGSNVRFRTSPSASDDSNIIASLSKGEYVEVLSVNNGWYKAIYNETTGYINSDYVDIVIEQDSVEVVALAAGGDASAASSDVQTLRQQVVDYAKTFLGCKYVYGTANGKTFDCSGLTSYVYKHFGYSLNRSAAGQLSNGTKIEKKNLVTGDLVLFRDTSISKAAASHVGIYIGSGQFIHASSGSSSRMVKISSLSDAYYTKVYIGARRIIQ